MHVPWTDALRFWWRLGCISFGGPAGQIALMHAELVERRRWISEARFLHALHFCMLLPGPEAQQLATYLGWLMHGRRGGIAAGLLFVLPGLLLMMALSAAYLVGGQAPAAAGVLFGLKSAVIALVLQAAQRLAARTLQRQPLRWLLAAGTLAAVGLLALPLPAVLAVAAGIGWLARGRMRDAEAARPVTPAAAGRPCLIDDHSPLPPHARVAPWAWLRTLALGTLLGAAVLGALGGVFGWGSIWVALGSFFTQAALIGFGGAYAVLPFVVQGAVEQHHWLSAAQMLDGLALGETTPGPLILVGAFVGFLGGWQQQALGPQALLPAGLLGAAVAGFFTFLPSFVFILAGAPWVERTRGLRAVQAPLSAIGAAVVGAILSLALFLARHHLWGAQGPVLPALLLSAAAWWGLRRGRWPLPLLLLACALAGWGLQRVGAL